MNYSDFLGIAEALWTALALIGIGLGLYLLRAERQDRALLIAENGRTGILSWALVVNESLKVLGHSLFLVAGGLALATPNPAAPSTSTGPVLVVLLVLFAALGVAQSAVLIYARQRIARYPVGAAAQQDTLLAVQRDVEKVSVKVGEARDAADAAYEEATGVTRKVAGLAKRTTASEARADTAEKRADTAEHRADASQDRADVAEKRADAAEEREP